jgi:hypothetical protein
MKSKGNKVKVKVKMQILYQAHLKPSSDDLLTIDERIKRILTRSIKEGGIDITKDYARMFIFNDKNDLLHFTVGIFDERKNKESEDDIYVGFMEREIPLEIEIK